MGRSARPRGLLDALGDIVVQHPLLETAASLEGLVSARPGPPPRGVFVGVGVCSRDALSVSLPLDVLGILAPAEEVRRVLAAERLIVLVADAHATAAGFSKGSVRRCADDVVEKLTRAGKALGLTQLHVVRASTLHETSAWQRAFAHVEARAPEDCAPYFVQQTADVAALQAREGGIVKVGWSLGGSQTTRRDEIAFDRFFVEHVGAEVGFLYTKAGRPLDDRRRKAPPYVTLDPSKRLCLEPDEDVAAKLARAERSTSRATLQGARRYYRALCASASRLSTPLRGPLEERLQDLIGRVFA